MKKIKVLGPGCKKCQTAYNNAMEAVRQVDVEADVIKIDDIEEMIKYNVLATPVLIIDEEEKVAGRVPQVKEIKELLIAQ